MAVLKNKDNTELLVDCNCGCEEGIRFRIDKDDYDYYCIMTYTNGNFYKEQGETVLQVIRKKLRKIWAIIRNKDFYYSEVILTQKDWEEYKEWINKH